jgi:diguanylate cyclase (GGDEF)-like protein
MITSSASEPSVRRKAAALGLSAALLGVGVLLTVAAGPSAYSPRLPLPLLLVVLVTAYLAAFRFTVDFELRGDTHSITLVQLPLALGVLIVAPAVHVAVRLAAGLIDVARQRQGPVKAVYNLAAGAFEVAAAAFAVGLVEHSGAPGPVLWLALYAGLLVGDVVGSLVLTTVWRVLGLPVTARHALQPLAVTAPVSLFFTCLAVVALTAVTVEPLTGLVMVVLAAGLALAYRTHRKTLDQQRATEQLYGFVKDLGPLDVSDDRAREVLEQVRVLLHARYLDLAVFNDGTWRHLVAWEGDATGEPPDHLVTLTAEVARTGTAALRARTRNGNGDEMATPLLGDANLLGILTASHRLGDARGFDMGDLRLLETVATELATALERGRMLAALASAATTDPLTGLPNLSEVTRQVADVLAATSGGLILAAVAVDSFREVNDTLGHQVGDDLLLEVNRRLRLSYPDAVVGRIGGGRFAVAVPASTSEGSSAAEMFGLGLRAQVEGGTQIGPVGTHIRLSVGVVQAPEHGRDAATLLRRAETAMYSARHAHGGPVLWEPAYEVKGQRRLAVVTALREAVAAGAIGLAYQPKVDTVTGAPTSVEALARWTHPALGVVRPDEFIPLAEASGLMGPLTASVLRQALIACKGWQHGGSRIGVAVNVSADTVLDAAFVTDVAATITAVDIPAELLTLELTEGVVVADPQLAVERMGELRALGVRISVDDFGTGYSSLTYLKGLPVDEVKIDKTFIDGLSEDPADRAVVRAVVDIAHTLGLKVVAEGVEQEQQLTILRSLGVDEVQGYLHARPMPAREAAAWLRNREDARL